MIGSLLDELVRRGVAGEPVALATVTATAGSAPRPPGSVMLVASDATVTGSVSAGCVEAAVYELCRTVLDTGSARLASFGDTDDEVFAPGLTCGGSIEVYVERIGPVQAPVLDQLRVAVHRGRPVAAVTCVAGPPASLGRWLLLDGAVGSTATPGGTVGPSPTLDGAVGSTATLGDAALDAVADRTGRDLLAAGRTGLVHPAPGVTLLVRSFVPPPRMIIFGASDFTAALAGQGRFLGYQVTVCDARPVFTTAQRFPDADEVVVDWPHRYLAAQADAGRLDRRTVLCVLTHDPRFDVPLLQVALGLPVAYLGAMGSRRSTDDRLARLRAAGVPPQALARLFAPIGLDLGARTPQETAVSVVAEIIAVANGRSGGRLTAGAGPIHPCADPSGGPHRTAHPGADLAAHRPSWRAPAGWSTGGEPQRQEEVDPVLEPAQVAAGQLFDPVDPIAQGVDVHMQPGGAPAPRATAVEKPVERTQQVGLVNPVVLLHRTEQPVPEPLPGADRDTGQQQRV
jgi:xanthine dehydrogenase accessory factor